MEISEVIFYIFAGISVLSAFMILLSRSILSNAFFLLGCFLGIAGLYVYAGAGFLAISQIMVYAGGVIVLMIFGIMYTHRPFLGNQTDLSFSSINLGALLISSCVAGLLFFFISKSDIYDIRGISISSEHTFAPKENISIIGKSMMTDYVVAFEYAGLLLLVALIIAVVLSSLGKTEQQ